MSADIVVNITPKNVITTAEGWGICLYVDTTKAMPYKLYDVSDNLTALEADFADTTDTYKWAETFVAQAPRPQKLAIIGFNLAASEAKATDIVSNLNTLLKTHSDFERIAVDDLTEAVIKAVSDWAETAEKMYYTLFTVAPTNDYSSEQRTVLNRRLAPATGTPQRIDAAEMGFAAARIPGSFTFKFKHLNNIDADVIDSDTLNAALDKNMNCYYEKFKVQGIGVAQIDAGKVANGDYIDTVESRDYVKALIGTEVAKLLTSNDKIPYDNTGIQQLVTCVNTALSNAHDIGIIANKEDGTPYFSVGYKSIDQMSNEDRLARKISGITFTYRELGGIHAVDIEGIASLTL